MKRNKFRSIQITPQVRDKVKDFCKRNRFTMCAFSELALQSVIEKYEEEINRQPTLEERIEQIKQEAIQNIKNLTL